MGGVEAITEVLGEELVKAGIDVRVVTETPATESREFPFEVIREPNVYQRFRLAQWADVIHSNSASVAMWPYAELVQCPFIWTHNGYQVACIDGLGWECNALAPIDPWASFWHHFELNGSLKALKGGAKLIFRRFVALSGVSLNIPATRWVSSRLGLPRSYQAYTPYPTKRFAGLSSEPRADANYLFVGRLVSEKGVDILLKAFKELASESSHQNERLLIIGDGPMRSELEAIVSDYGLQSQVEFTGALRGDALHHAMLRSEIAIVPSTWEEPMGGVTLELLATGRALIVSRRGGHAEVAGAAAVTFDNGSHESLAARMRELSSKPHLRERLCAAAPKQLNFFAEERLTAAYITVYKAVIQFWTNKHAS